MNRDEELDRSLLDIAVMCFGMIVATLGAVLLALGAFVPADATEQAPTRRGEAQISECSTTMVPLGWSNCTGLVRWENQPNAKTAGVQDSEPQTITVHAKQHLFGRVRVESHKPSSRMITEGSEWIVASDPPDRQADGRAVIAKTGAGALAVLGVGGACVVAFRPDRRGARRH